MAQHDDIFDAHGKPSSAIDAHWRRWNEALARAIEIIEQRAGRLDYLTDPDRVAERELKACADAIRKERYRRPE